MTPDISLRSGGLESWEELRLLYPRMFPEEDLVPLVEALLREPSGIWSILAFAKSELVGHVLFTKGRVAGSSTPVALLAPLGVAPEWQRQGIGSALVRHGLQQLTTAGIEQVFVLGDPAYYGRFGFGSETRVQPPYALPSEWSEAWQSRTLEEEDCAPLSGKLELPRPWLAPRWWGP